MGLPNEIPAAWRSISTQMQSQLAAAAERARNPEEFTYDLVVHGQIFQAAGHHYVVAHGNATIGTDGVKQGNPAIPFHAYLYHPDTHHIEFGTTYGFDAAEIVEGEVMERREFMQIAEEFLDLHPHAKPALEEMWPEPKKQK